MIWIILGLWALGFLLLPRVPLCPRTSQRTALPALSIIIPARNEEHNLRRLLTSINNLSTRPQEVIVVDDDSTDRTADIARELGATLLSAPSLPEGWRGKTWACQHGAEAAAGERLLFLDADTVLKSDALERIQAAVQPGDCPVLTLGPYHDVEKPYEELSAIFNLMTHMGMGAFSLFGSPDHPHGLFGPFLFIHRRAYNDVGGHAAVRAEILENMSLCELLRRQGIPMRCLGGRGVVHTRMYPEGLASLIEGWTKAFATGAAKTKALTLWLSVAWMTGAVLAAIFTVLALLDLTQPIALALTYPAYALSLYFMLRGIGRFSVWSSILYPLLLATFFIVFARSAFLRQSKRQVTWKGRSMDAVEREGS
jgi:4,4'-diaponeurosporenoate glycosyltransferase